MKIKLKVTTPLTVRERFMEQKGFTLEQMLQPMLDVYTELVVEATLEMKEEDRVGEVLGIIELEG